MKKAPNKSRRRLQNGSQWKWRQQQPADRQADTTTETNTHAHTHSPTEKYENTVISLAYGVVGVLRRSAIRSETKKAHADEWTNEWVRWWRRCRGYRRWWWWSWVVGGLCCRRWRKLKIWSTFWWWEGNGRDRNSYLFTLKSRLIRCWGGSTIIDRPTNTSSNGPRKFGISTWCNNNHAAKYEDTKTTTTKRHD